MNQIPKAVFSRQGPAILKATKTTAALADARQADGSQTLDPAPRADSWSQAYVAAGDLGEEIAALKAQDGGPIIAHGGASFARSLISRGLIDRYDLLIHPIALGQGLPIFSDLATARRLELVESRAFPSGAVAQVYRPADAG
jgi:dihydrofolate reductase